MAIGAAIGSVVGGLSSASAAKKGAQVQAEAARESNELQKEIYYQNREDLAPWRDAGTNALAAMQYELGLGARPTFGGTPVDENGNPLTITQVSGGANGNGFGFLSKFGGASGPPSEWRDNPNQNGTLGMWEARDLGANSSGQFSVGGQTFGTLEEAQEYVNSQGGQGNAGGFEYKGFQETPGYQFRLGEGQKALERNAAARGQRHSAATSKDFMRFGQGLASEEYGNFYNRLAGLSGTGQTATNTTAGLGQNYASAVGSNNRFGAQAQASGYAGQASALNSGINNLFSIYGAGQSGMFGSSGGLFGSSGGGSSGGLFGGAASGGFGGGGG